MVEVDTAWLYRRVVLPIGGLGLLAGIAGLALAGTHHTPPESAVLGLLGFPGLVDDVSTLALAGWAVFLAGATYRARYVTDGANTNGSAGENSDDGADVKADVEADES